jgi:hypothetical protein
VAAVLHNIDLDPPAARRAALGDDVDVLRCGTNDGDDEQWLGTGRSIDPSSAEAYGRAQAVPGVWISHRSASGLRLVISPRAGHTAHSYPPLGTDALSDTQGFAAGTDVVGMSGALDLDIER